MEALVTVLKHKAYKDSGVDWLGDIPCKWEVKRIKHSSKINPPPRVAHENLNTNACFLPMEAVYSGGQVQYNIQKPIKELKKGFTAFQRNDVIVAKITPCFENGKGAHLDSMPTAFGFGSTEFHVLRVSSGYAPKFIYYLTKSDLFMKLGEQLMTGSAGQKRVQTDFVENFSFACPPLRVQVNIVKFLEKKSVQIEGAIAIKEKQIALLKERKQIIIQQAVTQGLDAQAPMKESGVEWIGLIPEHWGIMANRVLFSERVEPGREGLPLLSVSIHSGVSNEEISEEKNVRGRVRIEDKSKYILVEAGDVAFNMMRAWQGGIGAVNNDGMVSPAYIVAKPKAHINAEYFELQYRCPEFIQQMDRYSKGITDFRKRLYWDNFKQLRTVVPPLEEQVEIIRHVKILSSKVDAGITLLREQIEKLKEYKTTLINSAVTGKIKVA